MPLDEAGALHAYAVTGIGEIHPGDDLARQLADALGPPGSSTLRDGDVVVVTQKIVSKAEGRLVPLDHEDLDAKVALVEREALRVLRRRGELRITETAHGFVCANAGIDLSNVGDGWAALLPVDPDRSARRIRGALGRLLSVSVGVVISDTFGRTWRNGVTDVAIGCAGIAAVVDLRGSRDATGRELVATQVCVADEVAAAAEIVMGKDRSVPAAVVRGVPAEWRRDGSVRDEIIRRPADDLFR
jgi:coenzyme F420-0:L-glutamate ligase/coenzyme F420-1:gamma-L-glutamate ligase